MINTVHNATSQILDIYSQNYEFMKSERFHNAFFDKSNFNNHFELKLITKFHTKVEISVKYPTINPEQNEVH